jgi:TPR repeat protein
MMKRVEGNDAVAIYLLAQDYYLGQNGLHQDEEKAKELYARAAGLGLSVAHYHLGNIYHKGGDLKKVNCTKWHDLIAVNMILEIGNEL